VLGFPFFPAWGVLEAHDRWENMTNIIMLIVCLLAGVLLGHGRRLPENASTTISGFIIHIALPALILSQIHGMRFSADMLWPVLMPWMLFAMSTALFVVIARVWRFSPLTTGALIMTAGLGNTSFVGLPMIETFYGVQQVSTGILIDQLGTYLVLSTAGIVVASLFSSSKTSSRQVLIKISRFPPLIALVFAFLLNSTEYPAWLAALLHRLGDTLAPLALVSVGLQLRLDQLAGRYWQLALGLGFKLVLAPLFLTLFFVGVLAHEGTVTRVTLFEAAMGPQIGGAIVAMQYGLNAPLITLMVGVGITLSFLTLPLWYLALRVI
jgi:predicted permease